MDSSLHRVIVCDFCNWLATITIGKNTTSSVFIVDEMGEEQQLYAHIVNKKKAQAYMIWYRIALRGNSSDTWHWKSPPFNSLHAVLGTLKLYRSTPAEHICVFLFTSTQYMDAMLQRANQGKLSTAIAVKQLWDAHHTNWTEIRRLEIELGEGGDHDQPFDGYLFPSRSQVLAWTRLRARRACGELLP